MHTKRDRQTNTLVAVAATVAMIATLSTGVRAAPQPAGMLEEQVGVTNDEVKIGSCAPLSGQMKARGAEVVTGGLSYFKYVNSHGGVHGRMINLISCDDRYDADGSIECFNSCLKGKVFIATLLQGTVPASKYVPMSDHTGLPIVGISSGPDFITTPLHPYVFQVRETNRSESQEQVRKLWKDLGYRRIGIAYQNDAYGAIVREGVVQALQAYGASPVAQVTFQRLETNLDSVIAELKAAKPDAVVLGCSGIALPTLVKRRQDIGKNVQLVGMSPGTDLVLAGAGKAADGMLITQVVPLTHSELPTVKLYHRVFEEYAHQTPNFSSFEGFLIAMVVVEGLQHAGKELTRSNFVKALESLNNFDMGLGPQFRLSYSPKNHLGFHGGVYWSIVKDGHVENVTDWKPLIRR